MYPEIPWLDKNLKVNPTHRYHLALFQTLETDAY